MDYPRIDVLDMHTGGEPLRIVKRGYPPILGSSILEKRRYARENLDHLRRFLMFEPRGHYDMYGAILVEPSLPDADLAVLFIHNEGYSTMCGHAIIALGRYAIESKLVNAVEPITHVNIECPCGLVRAHVEVQGGKAGRVSFDSVPAFLHSADVAIDVAHYGKIVCDVAYGGAFYAVADANQFGLIPGESPVRELVDAAAALSNAVRKAVTLSHPEHDDLAFLYGSILTDGIEAADAPSCNICVFADSEVDRSPTGSGLTARIAARVAHGKAEMGETAKFSSITGAVFEGTAIEAMQYGLHDAVRVRVGGHAHYSGEASYWLDDEDEIGKGFLVR